MGLFKSFDSPAFPREITDGNGHIWRNSEGVQPGRNGEPVYYPATGPEGWSLTPSEIEAEHGRRS
jgi:hypothetical protein